MHCLKRSCLGGIIIGSDFRVGRRRWGRGSFSMQNKSIGFGLSGETVDVIIGYGLTSKMLDEVGKSCYDGERELSKFVIVGS